MRYLILSCVLAFLLGSSHAEAQYLPNLLNIDSLTVSPYSTTSLSDIGSLTEMPTIDFPKEAKILVWWLDSNVDYRMPNALSPDESSLFNKLLRGNKTKKKDENGHY